MLHDPLRAQSLSFIAGCVLAVVAVAVCAILAFLRPAGELGGPIVMSRESGALYVRVGDTLHPVLNLASARLVAGTAAKPEIVSEAEIDKAKRGPSLGIPGAPAVIAKPLTGDESAWTVCDTTTGATETTTVIAAAAAPIGLTRSRAFSSHRDRRARQRRTCCTTAGGPKSTFATPRSCGHCGSTASSRDLFRVRCSMPFPKPRRSWRRTLPARARPDRHLWPDSPSARWCG